MELACLTNDFDKLLRAINKDPNKIREIAQFAGKHDLKMLIQFIIIYPYATKEVFLGACDGNQIELVKNLVSKNQCGPLPWGMYFACKGDSLEVFKWLELKTAYNMVVAFRHACEYLSLKIVDYFLLEKNFKVNDSLFDFAIQTNNVKYANMCIKNGYKVTSENFILCCKEKNLFFLTEYFPNFNEQEIIDKGISEAFEIKAFDIVGWMCDNYDSPIIECEFPKDVESVVLCLSQGVKIQCFKKMTNFKEFRVHVKSKHRILTESLSHLIPRQVLNIISSFWIGIH